MNEQEQEFADWMYAAIQNYSKNDERGQQSQQFRVGVSDVGYCSERTRRMLDQQVPEDADMLTAFLGTAIGDHVERAAVFADDRVLAQTTVKVRLTGETRTYDVEGHPDLIFPHENLVMDGKTSYGLQMAERMGADQQKNFQRHLYGMGALLGGLLDTDDPADVRVGNVWLDRSGRTKRVHAEIVPLDLEVVEEAARWVDGVVYAYLNREEAQKEPAREVCQATCGFYRTCRQHDTDVSGLLTDPEVVEAVLMYGEGADLARKAASLKDEAKPILEGMSGSIGTHTVRWIVVNGANGKTSTRIQVQPIKKGLVL